MTNALLTRSLDIFIGKELSPFRWQAINLTNGHKYAVTPESCTCPAAKRGVCKHQVSLSEHLASEAGHITF